MAARPWQKRRGYMKLYCMEMTTQIATLVWAGAVWKRGGDPRGRPLLFMTCNRHLPLIPPTLGALIRVLWLDATRNGMRSGNCCWRRNRWGSAVPMLEWEITNLLWLPLSRLKDRVLNVWC